MQSVVYGDYCSTANILAEIPAIFRGMFEIFRGNTNFIYISSTIFHGTSNDVV
jgi:hypothetical protein